MTERIACNVSAGVANIDTHNGYNNGQFTVPVSGMYHVTSYDMGSINSSINICRAGETITFNSGTVTLLRCDLGEWKKEKVKAGLEDILNGENSE